MSFRAFNKKEAFAREKGGRPSFVQMASFIVPDGALAALLNGEIRETVQRAE
ncbi:hypothetical protein N007_03035 [Alicyclobacillus acidoterrestris ATCC 49025]|nr:hypothetical protein N007_03035 [Alicyclobacillus acidoterrestris ATCC 49025]